MYVDGKFVPQETSDINLFSGLDMNLILSVLAVYLLVCGLVTATVAHRNGRSSMLGFLSGIFFGQFGIMTHMIMGKKEHFAGKKH
jgi:hypothetical protein